MPKTKILISNATYYGYHGVAKAEKNLGGKYQIDIEFCYDAESAAKTDSIHCAVNYQEVLAVASDILQNKTFNLIETLVDEIQKSVLERFSAIDAVTVRLRKLNAPVNQCVDFIQVERTIERT
jgi:dihydroneopterin aldolase